MDNQQKHNVCTADRKALKTFASSEDGRRFASAQLLLYEEKNRLVQFSVACLLLLAFLFWFPAPQGVGVFGKQQHAACVQVQTGIRETAVATAAASTCSATHIHMGHR